MYGFIKLQNSYEQGGLGLPNIAVKADALLLKQMCRMFNLPSEKSFHLMGYWLGGFLRDTGLDENFPELADLGPVSQMMSGTFPLHQYMLDTFLEAVNRGEVKRNNGSVVTSVLHDEVLRVGQQAAQLAGRDAAWDQQQNAAQGDDTAHNGQDDRPVTQGESRILANVTTKAICYINNPPFLLIYHFSGRVNNRRAQLVGYLLDQKNGK